ncbi:Alanyl tRNA synthetase second additional domain protein [mine drainage metagenome]|uniref:Alanyl tRNA synthetase second additional domain protein n=1 Tax=mine drainage metagenome TaxID=410659 RepID=T0YJP2_9ZZZZ
MIDTWSDGVAIHLISHDTYPDNIKGKEVRQLINWDIRYGHMKFRTALRIMTGIAYRDYKVANRVNQTYDDQAWVDLEIPEINEEIVKKIEDETNAIISRGEKVDFTYKKRDEVVSNHDFMTMTRGNIPEFPEIRLVKIGDLPYQPDFGTHVHNTKEVGKVIFKTTLIKGKVSKRVIVSLA